MKNTIKTALTVLAACMFAPLATGEMQELSSPSARNNTKMLMPFQLADGSIYLRAKKDFPVFKSEENATHHAELIDEGSTQQAEKFFKEECSKGNAQIIKKGDFIILVDSQDDFSQALPKGKIAPKKEEYITSDEPDKVKHGYSHNAYEVADSSARLWKASDSFLQDLRQTRLKKLYLDVFENGSQHKEWVSMDDDFTSPRQNKVSKMKAVVSQLNPSKPVIARKSSLFFIRWQDALLYAALVKTDKEIAKHFYVAKTASGDALHLPENSKVILKGHMTIDGTTEDLNENKKYLCCEETLLLICDENGKEYWITYSRLFGNKKKK